MSEFKFSFKDVRYIHPDFENPSDVRPSESFTRFEYPDGVIVVLHHGKNGKMFLTSNYGMYTEDFKTFHPDFESENSKFEDVI